MHNFEIITWDDSTPAGWNIIKGSAADPHSRTLVSSIWLPFGMLHAKLWAEHVPRLQNFGDCLPRPEEDDTRHLAQTIVTKLAANVCSTVPPRFSRVTPSDWVLIFRAIDGGERSAQAQTVNTGSDHY